MAEPKKRGARKTKSAKASIGEAAKAAVTGMTVKLEPSDIQEEPMPQKRTPRRKKAAAAADALAAAQGDAEASLLLCTSTELLHAPPFLGSMHHPAWVEHCMVEAVSVTATTELPLPEACPVRLEVARSISVAAGAVQQAMQWAAMLRCLSTG